MRRSVDVAAMAIFLARRMKKTKEEEERKSTSGQAITRDTENRVMYRMMLFAISIRKSSYIC